MNLTVQWYQYIHLPLALIARLLLPSYTNETVLVVPYSINITEAVKTNISSALAFVSYHIYRFQLLLIKIYLQEYVQSLGLGAHFVFFHFEIIKQS